MPAATLKKNTLTWDGLLSFRASELYRHDGEAQQYAGRCGAGAESATS